MRRKLSGLLKSLIPAGLVLVVLLAFAAPGAAADWDLESDTWVATDALGRTLPGIATCGSPKVNKTVGIFYFLWLDVDAGGIYDIGKILAANPTNPAWGPRWAFHHWGESELGYYASVDEYVIRKHCQMLVDAGVDVLCFDTTNAITYNREYSALCAVLQKIRGEGGRTPQICFVVNTDPAATVQKLYDDFYSKNLYPQLWYYWSGKPLLLSPPDGLSSTLLNFFTIRKTWAWNSGVDNWQFMSKYPQQVGYHTSPSSPEEVSVCVAEHPISNIGRSCQSVLNGGTWTPTEPATDQYGLCPTMDQGIYFTQQWSRVGTGAGQVNPPFVFVTGWNEWIAQRFIEGLDYDGISLAGRPLNDGETYFVDAYTQEFSRDIEPMKGGHTDNYYYQLADNVRRYKGVRKAMGPTPATTVAIDGSFSDWDHVQPEYRDTVGDTEHRNSIGYAHANTYVNYTGRNDFVRMKVARDADNIYFHAETSEDITPYTESNWMMLFIDSDCTHSTGWNGYDFLVNFPPSSSTVTTVKANGGGGTWNQVGTASYRVAGNKIEIAVPRSLIGQTGTAKLDFHWADNIQAADDITQFFVSGDSAPNRRFKYRYDTSASGPPFEFGTAGNLEGWSAAHSVGSMSSTGGSMVFNITGADPYVNGPRDPDIDASVYRYIHIRMKSNASDPTAEFFWGTQAQPYHVGGREVAFAVTNDNAFHDYYVDMASNSQWTGFVNTLRLDPSSSSTGHIEVDFIRLLPDVFVPTGSISINSGAATTTSPTVTLTLSAADTGSGVSKMRLSNDNANWTAWEDYSAARQWNLTPGDGAKTVYVQFRDRHMNRSATYSAGIQLLGVPPSGTVLINSGASYSMSASVVLSLSASGPSGVAEMRLCNSGAAWGDWQTYATSKTWPLAPGDGTRTVYAQFRDSFGRVSATAVDSILVDSTAPSGVVAISDGAAYTNSSSAYLVMSVTDAGSGVSQMRFVNSGSPWSAWESFAATKAWILAGSDGTKTVYAQFRDAAGNTSPTSTDTIVLDTVPPGVPPYRPSGYGGVQWANGRLLLDRSVGCDLGYRRIQLPHRDSPRRERCVRR